jgi:hypothetical protein
MSHLLHLLPTMGFIGITNYSVPQCAWVVRNESELCCENVITFPLAGVVEVSDQNIRISVH